MEVGHDEQSPAARIIWLVGTPIVLIVGMIGNSITLAVFLKPKNRTSSTAIYFIWLAFADMVVILVDVPRWWVIYLYGYDVRHYSHFMCKSHMLGIIVPSTLSSYVLTALTIERLISVMRPHQMKTICTVRSAHIVCISVIAACVPLSGMVVYGYGITPIPPPETNQTDMVTDDWSSSSSPIDLMTSTTDTPALGDTDKVICSWYRDEKSAIAMKMDQVVQFFVGFFFIQAVMIIADAIIIYKLVYAGKVTSSKQSGHIRQITVTLLTVNIVYMLCRTPVYVFMSFINKPELNAATEVREITWAIINVLFFTNHAVNFFLYVMIGERFRRQVAEMMCKWRRTDGTNSVVDSNEAGKAYKVSEQSNEKTVSTVVTS